MLWLTFNKRCRYYSIYAENGIFTAKKHNSSIYNHHNSCQIKNKNFVYFADGHFFYNPKYFKSSEYQKNSAQTLNQNIVQIVILPV